MTAHRESFGKTLSALVKLAWPLMVANLFFSLQIFIDRLFLSQYDPELAGATLTGAMLMSIPTVLIQNTAGFATTFVAQYYGARQFHRIGPVIWQGIFIALFCGLAILVIYPLAGSIIRWVAHEVHIQVWEKTYYQWLILCVLPLTLIAAVSGFFSGRGRTTTVIAINAVGCLVNVGLDYCWILGRCGFEPSGIDGAGAATLVGCWSSAILAVTLFLLPRFESQYKNHSGFGYDGKLLRRLLYFGFPNGLQSCADLITWSLFGLFVGWLGTVELTATSIIFCVNAIFYIPMIGLGQAAGVYVGQRIGENRPHQAEYGMWVGLGLTIIFMTIMGLSVALFPEIVIRLFASDVKPETWSQVASVLPGLLWIVALYSPFDGINTLLAFGLRGAGDTRFISICYILCGVPVLIIPCWWICTHQGPFYLTWIMATFYLVALSLCFFPRFVWGPWRSMRVIEMQVDG